MCLTLSRTTNFRLFQTEGISNLMKVAESSPNRHIKTRPCSGKSQPIPKRQILDSSKQKEFTDDNLMFHKKWQKVLQKDRKHCGKRRNRSFSHGVYKRLLLQTRKNQGLFGKELIWISQQF